MKISYYTPPSRFNTIHDIIQNFLYMYFLKLQDNEMVGNFSIEEYKKNIKDCFFSEYLEDKERLSKTVSPEKLYFKLTDEQNQILKKSMKEFLEIVNYNEIDNFIESIDLGLKQITEKPKIKTLGFKKFIPRYILYKCFELTVKQNEFSEFVKFFDDISKKGFGWINDNKMLDTQINVNFFKKPGQVKVKM